MNKPETFDKYRQKYGLFGTKNGEPFGLFFIKVSTHKTPLKVILAPIGQEWEHVSVSLPNRCPTWEEMCIVKDIFFGNRVAVQFHPEKDEYVNNHPYCLHLWASNNKAIETPPSILVGIK